MEISTGALKIIIERSREDGYAEGLNDGYHKGFKKGQENTEYLMKKKFEKEITEKMLDILKKL